MNPLVSASYHRRSATEQKNNMCGLLHSIQNIEKKMQRSSKGALCRYPNQPPPLSTPTPTPLLLFLSPFKCSLAGGVPCSNATLPPEVARHVAALGSLQVPFSLLFLLLIQKALHVAGGAQQDMACGLHGKQGPSQGLPVKRKEIGEGKHNKDKGGGLIIVFVLVLCFQLSCQSPVSASLSPFLSLSLLSLSVFLCLSRGILQPNTSSKH